MDRKDFIKYMNERGFITTNRFNGDHEIFKSEMHRKNFIVPRGKKDISKSYLWRFRKLIKEDNIPVKFAQALEEETWD